MTLEPTDEPPIVNRVLKGILLVLISLTLMVQIAQWIAPDGREFAEVYRPVIQAVADFRAANGRLPKSVEELVPKFIPALPDEVAKLPVKVKIEFAQGSVRITRDDGRRTQIEYSFVDGQEGWVYPPELEPVISKK